MSLCGPCTSVFREKTLAAGTIYNHHPSWTSFVAAADEKCDMCWRVFDILSKHQQDRLRRFGELVGNDARIAASSVGVAVGKSGYINVEFAYNLAFEASYQRSQGLIDIETQKELDGISNILYTRCPKLPFLPSDVGNDFVKPINGESTSSASTWDLVLSWLCECKSTHQRCADRRNNLGWYPTRLLDIQSSSALVSSKEESFKIVDGSDIPSGLDYVSLSHRWGSSKMPRLTVANMPRYRGGVLISELPTTFRDAITITRRLGVRYLWIDSLCIIQEGDDGHDWVREGSLMAQVYSNCLMNVSADWGSGEDGLFFSRNPRSFRKFELELRITVGEQKRNRKRLRTTDHAMYTHVPIYNLEEIEISPLAGRGWVFQERILSPIVLHFGSKEVVWECCQKLVSENLPQGLPNISLDHMSLLESATLKRLDPSGDPYWTQLLSQAFRSLPASSTVDDAPYLLWWFLMARYCRCALTYTSDRLVAISGIARYIKNIIKDQYIAGMWRKYLTIEMGWSARSPTSGRHLEMEPVQLLSSPADSTTDRRSRKPVLEDIFGPLTEPGIQIRVRGSLKLAKIRRGRRDWYILPIDNHESDGYHSDNEPKGVLVKLDFIPSEIEEAEFPKTTFFYMPWYTYSYAQHTRFMLLELQNAQHKEFRRVGIFRPIQDDLEHDFLRDQLDQHLLPGYDDVTGKYTVFIV
ncbi:heterokaryon incompatibility protein-domain-containing protein [Annulohypoxylon stygium]|nr:heterokaryon incompatibility protein-domain-containing protein [Annulohypoxylon stygium]